MPPPGGDGYNALQTGGAFAEDASSLYYNPAAVAGLERSTGSRFHTTYSRQDLLPEINISDFYQDFFGAAVIFADRKHGFDVGIELFRNHINFGKSPIISDSNSNQPPSSFFNSSEAVYGLGAAIRLGTPISIGGTLKFYDSRLSPGDVGRATGLAFDWGILVNPTIHPLLQYGVKSLDITPSIGLSWLNLGDSVHYGSSSYHDPLPKTLRAAIGAQIRFFELAEFSMGRDAEVPLFVNESVRSPTITYGYSLGFFGLRWSEGKLEDPLGDRFERHYGVAYEFNLLQWHRLAARMQSGDLHSSTGELDTAHPYPGVRLFGALRPVNPRVVVGRRWIEGNGLRDDQKAWYFSLSL